MQGWPRSGDPSCSRERGRKLRSNVFRLGSTAQPRDHSRAAPKLYVMTVNQPLGLFFSFIVIGANQRFKAREMAVFANNISAILWHTGRPQSRRSQRWLHNYRQAWKFLTQQGALRA